MLTEAPSEVSGTETFNSSGDDRQGMTLGRWRRDAMLVDAVRRGNPRAFEAIYSRHSPAIFSYCRHVLGCRHEAEDAVQQTFLNALRAIKADDRELKLRPWLYRIAYNHCISVIRRRRERPVEDVEASIAGLTAEVEQREEVREMLRDLADLPDAQRDALVMSELRTLSHAQIAERIGCPEQRVKALVFQARQSLTKGREAREVSCDEIRDQLNVLRGGALRRSLIRRHLRDCEGCREFRLEVRRQRTAAAFAPGAMQGQALAGAGVGGAAMTAAGGGKAASVLIALKAIAAGGLTALSTAAGVAGHSQSASAPVPSTISVPARLAAPATPRAHAPAAVHRRGGAGRTSAGPAAAPSLSGESQPGAPGETPVDSDPPVNDAGAGPDQTAAGSDSVSPVGRVLDGARSTLTQLTSPGQESPDQGSGDQGSGESAPPDSSSESTSASGDSAAAPASSQPSGTATTPASTGPSRR